LGWTGDLVKGERVYVEGKARLSRWSTKEGQLRVNLQVTAARVLVLDRIGRKRRKPTLPPEAATDITSAGPAMRDWQRPPAPCPPGAGTGAKVEIPFAAEVR
jgi:single-stranded DNA-binding protein